MRVLAIGDIHGWASALDALLYDVSLRSDDLIVTLGDYVDRGPDAKGVIDRVLHLATRYRVVSLIGNHEHMMLSARTDERWFEHWLERGGDQTLTSYAGDASPEALDAVPPEHWHFLEKTCLELYRHGSHIFVHAGLSPEVPLPQQQRDVVLFQRFHDPKPHMSGRTMVCGHTVQANAMPKNLGHAICLDTGLCWGGWLTCMDVKEGTVWQANQSGQTRRLHVSELSRLAAASAGKNVLRITPEQEAKELEKGPS